MVRIPGFLCPGLGSVLDQGTEILQTQCGRKKGRKKNIQEERMRRSQVWLVWERISDGGNTGREARCFVVQLQVLDSSGTCANHSSSTFLKKTYFIEV